MFNFTYDPGTTVQQMLGMEMAGRIWDSYLNDNVTLNIHVGVAGDLASNVIGGALPGMRASQSYLDYRTALNNGPKSADDNTALGSLPNATTYSTSFQYVVFDSYQWQTENRSTLNMTRAVAKAAGMGLTDGTTALDGYILFSNLANATANGQSVRWSYDYTRSSTQATNTLDFLSTAIHEIGHVLGFVSGVDQPGLIGMLADWSAQTNAYAAANPGYEAIGSSSQSYIDSMRNRLQYINPLDLFRYSAPGTRDMTNGSLIREKYFSLNGGTTNIATFSSGLDTSEAGDGYQASHWKNGTTAIMNPTLSLNTRRNVAALDLRAFDVIGWDIVSTGASTTINLSSLQTQSQQALATRANQTTTWINNNLTASPTALVANRDQMIYTMMQNSVVYDMTRVPPPSSTGGVISRQTLAQVFQQRSLFSTVDELDGWVPEALPPVDGSGLGPAGADLSALNSDKALAAVGTTIALDPVLAVSPGEILVSPALWGNQIRVQATVGPSFSQQPLTTHLTALDSPNSPITPASENEDRSVSSNPIQARAYGGGAQNYWHGWGPESEVGSDRPVTPDNLTLTSLTGIPLF